MEKNFFFPLRYWTLTIFTNPSAQVGYDTRSILSSVYRFEFRVFILLD